ncbi:efflux RND transporter periplasmic adaptor subunit [Monashia sp. NPDC004114]
MDEPLQPGGAGIPGPEAAADPAEMDEAAETAASGRRPRGRRRLRRWMVVVAVAVLVAGAAGAFALSRRQDPNAAAAQTRTVTASRTTLQQTVSSTGTLEPSNEADLSFSAAGTVTTLDATVGQKVTKGQRLATIDDTSLQSQVELAQSQVDQAQTQVDDSSSGTTAQIAAANAQLASAKAKLSSAQEALAGATLTAPFDGVIASVNTQVGDRVSGSSSGTGSSGGSGGNGGAGNGSSGANGSSSQSSSTAAVTVISTNSWIVTASVTNADLPSIKAGLQATIIPTGSATPVFGTVKTVGIVASSSSSGVAQFPVTIAVTGKPTGLYAGTSVSVSIVVKQLNDVLTVPTLAVRTENGQTVVSLVKNGATVTTPVTVGQVFGAQTQITKGLAEGDQVEMNVATFQRGAGTGTGTNGGRTGTGGFGGTGLGGGFGGGGFGGGFGAPPGGAPGGGQGR